MAPEVAENLSFNSIGSIFVHNEAENPFASLARKHWLKSTKTIITKVNQEVLKKEIWDLLEKDEFSFKLLSDLENLQILERYLWPGFSVDASNFHVLLIVLILNFRNKEHLLAWDTFLDKPSEFSSLFRRIISLSVDNTLQVTVKTHVLSFVISSFQSLDSGLLRRECAPLVSISIWHNISSEEKRKIKIEHNQHVRKAWRAATKRYETADDSIKPKLRFDRLWLYTLILDFFKQLYNDKRKYENIRYCERFIELLIDLLSQLPTRRYVNTLLQDLNTLPAIRLSPAFNDEGNGLLRDLYALLKHYSYFSIDDHTGLQHDPNEIYQRHSSILAVLQRIAFKNFKEKLTILALSNYGSIDKRNDLKSHLDPLSDEEIFRLCDLLHLRTSYPASAGIVVDRSFLTEVLLSHHERQKSFQESAQELSILPTELTLFESALLRNDTYNGTQPLAIPKLNLQYLTVGDFLWRSFILHRYESFYEIRKYIEDVVKRLRPVTGQNRQTRFEGFFKMALPISKPAILEVVPPLVGYDKPSSVRAEIALDVSRLSDENQKEWSSLRPNDVVFLLAIQAPQDDLVSNLETTSNTQNTGLKYLRTAEVIQTLDEKGRSLNDQTIENIQGRPRLRKLHVKLDASMYKEDMEHLASGKSDIYESINVIVRRRGRENNFKPILESMQSLTLTNVSLATWLHDVFLGYGDPAGASYMHLPNKIQKINYRDTFLDLQHLTQCLQGMNVVPSNNMNESSGPPYVLQVLESTEKDSVVKISKKRRRDAEAISQPKPESVHISTCKSQNTGPYPTDVPKLNQIRFTPTQAKAIISGSQPGLTLIVGPPGTGKTDVATQIINIIYHNFPKQRTLLIAHSNQALNQLFQKIVALDIDERHLLRLGHGDDLDTESNFSKHGRVDSFLENRDAYLREVDRLAANFGAPGAHGSSAETAGYFNLVYVEPAWRRFNEILKLPDATPQTIIQAFPFHQYFSNAPQPLFPAGADKDKILDIANGCYLHVSKIFAELADVRPFEVLRRDRDKANYLLTNEARIIAMTSTHAAMRRREIASLDFHYDNVIMEEAAQITEIESFIPLSLQRPKNGEMPLQRVILCGDHFQNSPSYRTSRFERVPTINLDQQGRARSSIASLYSWRYVNLGNLPNVSSAPEFQVANAGFKYEYQFINVPDYQGQGESEPTPHFTQNLGEAEYAVAIYQYMRLIGYPATSISILATYAGQRTLIKNLLSRYCTNSPFFGFPKNVTTVDKYQGEQNDYVILSLTRTTRVGYLREIRRLTVALSRARLGLYILGRREVFESCLELHRAFDILLQRPDKLTLVSGEQWPCQRAVKSESQIVPGEFQIEGVENLRQYLDEKLEQLDNVGPGMIRANTNG